MIRNIFILFFIIVYSNINGQPLPPTLTYVTVEFNLIDISGRAVIHWTISETPDVIGYYIYMPAPEGETGWNIVDTVLNRQTDFWAVSINKAQPYQRSESFVISSFTGSNVSMLVPVNSRHSTMYAFPYFERCSKSVLIDWTPYVGWDYVVKYKIYYKTENSSYQFLGEAAGTESSIKHYNITTQNYCYYVEAISADGLISQSNQTCFTPDMPTQPKFLEAEYATVVENSQINVSFHVDKDATLVDQYKLLRSNSASSNFFQIAIFPKGNSSNIVYQDKEVDLTKSYYYKLVASDISCQQDVDTSNLASNITLDIKPHNDLSFTLNWNKYQNFIGGTKTYNIYREAENYNAELVKSFELLELTTYNDNLSVYTQNKYYSHNLLTGKYCYYVEAIEDDYIGSVHNLGISRSNTVCKELNPRVYIPNCIYPNSLNEKNRIFLPSVIYPYQDYSLAIFNRWGEKVFETRNVFTGWDALLKKGGFAPAGVYVYILRFVESNGDLFEKSGEFLVYYP